MIYNRGNKDCEYSQNNIYEYSNNRTKYAILSSFLLILILSISGYSNGYSMEKIIQIMVFIILINTILILYIENHDKNIIMNPKNRIIISASYCISMIFVVLAVKYDSYNLFLLGPVLMSMLVDMNLGISFMFYFTFLFSIITNSSMEGFVTFLLFGIIVCFLSQYIVDRKKVGYICLILLSTNLTLVVILKRFEYSAIFQKDTLYTILSTLLLTILAYVINLEYNKKIVKCNILLEGNQYNTNQDEIAVTMNPIEEEKTVLNNMVKSAKPFDKEQKITKVTEDEKTIEEDEKSIAEHVKIISEDEKTIEGLDKLELRNKSDKKLQVILQEDYTLVVQLQNYSQHLFSHSVEVAELSRKAAVEVKADALLAKAGGLYHEIGRVIGNDYIIEGINLTEKYGFPKEVIDIIKQHNSKLENPTSVEAAIVMLSDSLITTLEYIKNKPDKANISKEKLLGNIFQVRIFKGCLDESGLSIKDINKLREFYIKNCPIYH